MTSIKTRLGRTLLALSLSVGAVCAAEKSAPIHFGDITWESGSFITEVLRLIVEKGYGYPTDTLPGSTVSLDAGTTRRAWAYASYAVANAARYGVSAVSAGDRTWTSNRTSLPAWEKAAGAQATGRVTVTLR